MFVSFECAASLWPTVQPLGNPTVFYSMQHAQPQAMVVMSCVVTDTRPLLLSAEMHPVCFDEESEQSGCLLEAIGNTAARQVVDRQLDGYLVARQDFDVVHAHFAGNMRQNLMAVLEFDLEHRVRKGLEDRAFKFDDVFFCQESSFFTHRLLKQQPKNYTKIFFRMHEIHFGITKDSA